MDGHNLSSFESNTLVLVDVISMHGGFQQLVCESAVSRLPEASMSEHTSHCNYDIIAKAHINQKV